MSEFFNNTPRIKTVKFPKGKIHLYLNDGRIIYVPISKFPEIKKLSVEQRKRCNKLAGFGLMFDDLDEVYHISDFLGANNTACL
ncbi:MAG TPA: DUF2442 domain-containing protein [bacterium]|nr:DUF2442 domain-containing protein [bacterium]